MLALTRKVGERIVAEVGDVRIEFKIVGVRGSKVKVGVTAPTSVPVMRGELVGKRRRDVA